MEDSRKDGRSERDKKPPARPPKKGLDKRGTAGANADTIVVVNNVPSPSKTWVHVIAMSDMDAPAKKWAAQIMEAIKNDPRTTTTID